MQKAKVRKELTLNKKMKVGDEVKRGKPVMDVAAEFGVLLCYIIAAYARLIAIDLAYHCFVSSPGDLRDKENVLL